MKLYESITKSLRENNLTLGNLISDQEDINESNVVDLIGTEAFADAVANNEILKTYKDFKPNNDMTVEFTGDLSKQLYKFVKTDTDWEAYKIGNDGRKEGDAFSFIHFESQGLNSMNEPQGDNPKPINEADKITADDFLESTITVYDLADYVEHLNLTGGEKGVTYTTHLGNERAVLNTADGKIIVADYEAVRDLLANENDKLTIDVSPKEPGFDENGHRTIHIFPTGTISVPLKDIIKDAPKKQMKAKDFFTKWNYNSRCSSNFQGMVDNLNGIYHSKYHEAEGLQESYCIVNYYDEKGEPKEKIVNGNSPKAVEVKVKRIADRYEITDISQASADVSDSEYLNSLGKGVLRKDTFNSTFEESSTLKESDITLEFLKDFTDLVKKHCRVSIDDIRYVDPEITEIVYSNGTTRRVNTGADSTLAAILDITKELLK